jgi:Tfp pilus assembly protein PilV
MKKTKGFSIGEVMVAVFIMLVGIVGAIMLTARSIQDLGDSRESIVATLLAQEGTELVRNLRDNNVTQMKCGDSHQER